MEYVNVSSQAELEKAVKAGNIPVCRDGFFRASGSATVKASGSATVRAFDSATVEASDSATVKASGSATVRAFDSATVEASDSATVEASDSATVGAFDSATVRASGSATVRAFDSATVRAAPYVGVTRHGTRVKVNGGVLIQIPEIQTTDEFLGFYGLKASRGSVTLFKLVGEDFLSGHGVSYRPGEKPTAPDWLSAPCCGNGLHFSPRPFMARKYSSGTRFVACRVKLGDLVVITEGYGPPDKVKAKGCTVLYECDEDGAKKVTA